jgi:GST-like protein
MSDAAQPTEHDDMYDVHYWPTPNGKKVTILLEELELPYHVVPVDIGRGDQFTDAFLKMNPNHRMPVLIDRDPAGSPTSPPIPGR